MFDTVPVQSSKWFRTKNFVFAFVAVMMAYVLFHNERFLLDPADPVWQHYESFKWWLLPHGLAGACALLLVPMQFSDRLRRRFTKLHRVIGRVYVAGALGLPPLGAYLHYRDESAGSSRSFTVAGVIDAAILMITTGIGFAFALKRNIPQHRQWMTRSYAVALVFFEVRVILGVTGWDRPVNFATVEAVLWACLAFSVLLGDLANQWYELRSLRPRTARTQAAQSVAASAARP